jgi:hypothetical protein
VNESEPESVSAGLEDAALRILCRLSNMLVAIGINVALRVAYARRSDFDPLFAAFRIISEFAP